MWLSKATAEQRRATTFTRAGAHANEPDDGE
jgi:hypothetical protein